MYSGKIIGAVEIGASKVSVLIGEVAGKQNLNIVGLGLASSQGIAKGEVLDFKAASNACHAAIIAAEQSAGVTLEKVYISQSGRHVKGFLNRGIVRVNASDSCVSEADILKVGGEAKSKQLPPGRVYLHHIQNAYQLDGRLTKNPIGMHGDQLEAFYWSVHADEKKLSDYIHIINGFGLTVDDVILSSVASGVVAADDSDKRIGCIVIDIGCGTTDYAVYKDGVILKTGVIPVGGDHITNDLSVGLRIHPKHAEELKIRFGRCLIDKEDKKQSVMLFGDFTIGDREIKRYAINQIVNARVDELIKVLKSEISEELERNELSAGVILTGGCAQLDGLVSLVSDNMRLPARIANAPSWARDDLKKNEFSTVLGLMHFALTGYVFEGGNVSSRNNVLKKVAKLLKLN